MCTKNILIPKLFGIVSNVKHKSSLFDLHQYVKLKSSLFDLHQYCRSHNIVILRVYLNYYGHFTCFSLHFIVDQPGIYNVHLIALICACSMIILNVRKTAQAS